MKLLIFFIFSFLIFSFGIDYTPLNLKEKKNQTIQVEVRGEINNPGIFTLKAPSTFQDLIPYLDLNQESSLEVYSYQKILLDEEIIVIPSNSETNQLISINSASLNELMTLPGIKDALANRIIQYRQQNGGFKSLEELMEVKGIGEAKYNKIKEFIRL